MPRTDGNLNPRQSYRRPEHHPGRSRSALRLPSAVSSCTSLSDGGGLVLLQVRPHADPSFLYVYPNWSCRNFGDHCYHAARVIACIGFEWHVTITPRRNGRRRAPGHLLGGLSPLPTIMMMGTLQLVLIATADAELSCGSAAQDPSHFALNQIAGLAHLLQKFGHGPSHHHHSGTP